MILPKTLPRGADCNLFIPEPNSATSNQVTKGRNPFYLFNFPALLRIKTHQVAHPLQGLQGHIHRGVTVLVPSR